MRLIVRSHKLRRERLRKEVVVQGVFLRYDFTIDRETVVHPIGQIGANFTLTRAVIEVGVLYRLGAAHLVDTDVTIGDRPVGQGEVQPERTTKENCSAADDEPISFPLSIV